MAQLKFPKAFIAMDNGDLVQVTNFSMQKTNGAKQKHSLRRPAAGISTGNREHTCTWDSEVDENGPERNYWKACERGDIKQVRIKAPGGRTTFTVEGAFSQVNIDQPLDDAFKVSCTFIGDCDAPEI